MVGRRRSGTSDGPPSDGGSEPRVVVPTQRRGLAPRALVFLSLLCLIVVLGAAATSSRPTSKQPLGVPGRWHLVLNSEFNGKHLPADWTTGWLSGGVTRPVNGYENDCYSPADVTFPGDGSMHLNVTATSSTCGGRTYPYTGALVSTDPDSDRGGGFEYTYGVLQVRVYIPAAGTGIEDWPQVWADGTGIWPQTGEDDLMEGIDGRACYHFHDPLGGPGRCDRTITAGWHTFTSDWQPGSVTYYYDGADVGRITTGVTSAPMFLLLDNTTKKGQAIPDSMRVQYVRVWQSS
jgi:hypothetical protein